MPYIQLETMISGITKFLKLLDKQIIQLKIRQYIYNYAFYYIENEFNIDQYPQIKNNIKDSNMIVIDSFNDCQHIIICFKEIIITINQKLISNLQDLFLLNDHATYIFDKNAENIFFKIFKHLKIKIYKPTKNFDLFDIANSLTQLLKFHSDSNELQFAIRSSIAKYLIGESYSKTIYNRFELNFIVKENEMNENDHISLKNIDQGSSFTVYLYYHIPKQLLFAKKILLHDSENHLANREHDHYLNINHPLIPKYFGKFQNDHSIAIEYINGQTLLAAINEKKIVDINDKIYIIIQIMLIIEFIHLKNYILRDLKPNNIIITNNKTVIIIDFDKMISFEELSKSCEHSNDFSSPYAYPPINSNDITNLCDIYSLGKLIYFIICGKIPYEDNLWHISEESSIGDVLLYQFYNMCIEMSKNDISLKNILTISRLINLFSTVFIKNMSIFNIKKLYKINSQMVQQNFKLELTNEYIKEAIDSIKLRDQNGKVNSNQILDFFGKNSISKLNNYHENIILGYIILTTNIDEYNINKAISYFLPAADQKDPNALTITISLLINSTDKDINKIIHYLTIYADLGDVHSLELLGYIFLDMNVPDFYQMHDIDKVIDHISKVINYNSQDLLKSYEFLNNFKNIKKDNKKAIEYLTRAANQNSSIAKLILGNFFYFQNYKSDAINYFISSSEQNNICAQYILGTMFLDNENYNLEKAILYLKMAAKQNSTEAQFLLGEIYLLKKNDIDKAIFYFQMAADNNHSNSQFMIGVLLMKFQGSHNIIINNIFDNQNIDVKTFNCKKDMSKAIKYLLLSTKQNNSDAQFYLALCYLDNIYITPDPNKGIYYLSAASNQNNNIAQYCLGCCYYYGKFVPKDEKIGEHYLKLSAKQNNLNAQLMLGIIYCNDKNRIDEGIHYLILSAIQNCPYAQLHLGDLYSNKKSHYFNMEKAISYYKKAAINNEPISQYKLGLYYLKGHHITQNISCGLYYLTQSANAGYLDSYFKLGFIYHSGKYAKCDMKKAIYFYKEGSSFDDQFSKNNLGIIYKYGIENLVEKNITYSIIYFTEAIKKKDRLSMFNLAKIYIFDYPTKENYIDESIKLLIYSSNLRLPIAIDLLCFALIIKYGFDYLNFIGKFRRDFRFTSKYLVNAIANKIYDKKLYDPKTFQIKFDNYRSIDYLYNIQKKHVLLNDIMQSNATNNNSKSKLMDIDSNFYDGFKIDIK